MASDLDRGDDRLHHVGRMARGSALLVSSGVVAYAGAFLLAVVVARSFGKTPFGLWALAVSVGQLLSIVGLFGADWIVMRQGSYFQGIGDEPRFRRTIHVALAVAGIGSVVLGLGLFVTAGTLAEEVFHDPDLTPLLRLTAVMGPIVAVRQVLVYATQAFKDMKDAALIRNVLQPALRLGFVAVAIVASDDLVVAYGGLVLAEVALLAIALVVVQRRIALRGPVGDVPAGGLLRFALPAWGSRLAGQSRGQVMPVLLGSLATISTTAVYTASSRISGALTAVVNSLNQVYTAIGSDLYLQGRREEFASVYRSATKWTFTLGAPLLALMLAFPGELLSFFGSGFRSGEDALMILAIGLLFHFGTGPVTVTLIIVGRSTLALIDYVVVIAVEIGLALWLIPRYGLIGGAIAKAVGTATNNVVPLIQVWMRERVLPYRLDFWKPAVAAVSAALVARIVVEVLPVGDAVIAATTAAITIGLVYVPLVLVLGLNDEDKAALQALTVRRRRREAPVEAPPDVGAPTIDP